MYTILIAVIVALLLGSIVWSLSGSVIFAVLTGIATVIVINLLVGRYFMKKLKGLMDAVEKDLRAERIDMAVEKLKSGYKDANWQLLLKKQLDSQIGSILYLRKKFDDALPYLQNSFAKNWAALSMLASYYYRNKNYDEAYKVMDKAISSNKKEPFVYSLYAYFLSEQGHTDRAINILNKGTQKLPLDERLANGLDNLKNKKKIKMQTYGPLWMQLHLGKTPDGVRQYQAHLANQRVRRR